MLPLIALALPRGGRSKLPMYRPQQRHALSGTVLAEFPDHDAGQSTGFRELYLAIDCRWPVEGEAVNVVDHRIDCILPNKFPVSAGLRLPRFGHKTAGPL